MTELTRLHPDDIAAIVSGVVDAITIRADELRTLRASPELSDAFNAAAWEIAQCCGVKPAWVREHAAELGGVRIGTGTKPRHRFSLATATERIAAMRSDTGMRTVKGTEKERQRTSRRASPSAVPLLAIKGRMPT